MNLKPNTPMHKTTPVEDDCGFDTHRVHQFHHV